MMRGTPEGCVEVAGEKLRYVAERVCVCERGVGPERLIAYVRTPVAVSADRNPTREERPDRATVIRERIVKLTLLRDDARAPVRRHRSTAEMVNLALRALFVQHAPPERDGGHHRVFVNQSPFGEFVHSRRAPLAVWAGVCFHRRILRLRGTESIKAAFIA